MDSASVTKETIGLSRWTNKQNARDLKELSDYQKEIHTYLGRKNSQEL